MSEPAATLDIRTRLSSATIDTEEDNELLLMNDLHREVIRVSKEVTTLKKGT